MLAKISQSARLMPSRPRIAPQPLAAAFPGRDMPVLLEEGARRQERVGEALERPELQPLHDLHGHVVEGPTHEVGVGQVAQRVDADQEQHVDLAVGARPQDAHRVAPGLAASRPPGALDLVDLVHRAATGQQRRMHAGHAARLGRSPGASRTGTARRPRRSAAASAASAPPVALAGEHDARARRPPAGASSASSMRRPPRPDKRRLVARRRTARGSPRPAGGSARMQHPDARPAPGGLAQAQVQDRHFLFGVEAAPG